MIPVNDIMNHINEWNDPAVSTWKTEVGSRFENLFVTTPTEAVAVLQNVLIAPVQAAGLALKTGARAVSWISGSEAVKRFEEKMPNLPDFILTLARIVVYSIGTVLTATLGVISPSANFNIHCSLGIAINRKEELLLLEEEIRREAEENKIEAKKEGEIKQPPAVFEKKMAVVKENLEEAFEGVKELFEKAEETVKEKIDRALEDVTASDNEGDVEEDYEDALDELEADDEEEKQPAALTQTFTGGIANISKKIVNFVSFGRLFENTSSA